MSVGYTTSTVVSMHNYDGCLGWQQWGAVSSPSPICPASGALSRRELKLYVPSRPSPFIVTA